MTRMTYHNLVHKILTKIKISTPITLLQPPNNCGSCNVGLTAFELLFRCLIIVYQLPKVWLALRIMSEFLRCEKIVQRRTSLKSTYRSCIVIMMVVVWNGCCGLVSPLLGPFPSNLLSSKSVSPSHDIPTTNSFAFGHRHRHRHWLASTTLNAEDDENREVTTTTYNTPTHSERRRSLFIYSSQLIILSAMMLSTSPDPSTAATLDQFISRRKRTTYIMDVKNNTVAESLRNELQETEPTALNAELCLLRLLPIKQPVFRQLQAYMSSLSALQNKGACQCVKEPTIKNY